MDSVLGQFTLIASGSEVVSFTGPFVAFYGKKLFVYLLFSLSVCSSCCCFIDYCVQDWVNVAQPKTITVSVVSSISEVASSEWDACALDATGSEKFNPFLTHGFLSTLEDTGCAVKVWK